MAQIDDMAFKKAAFSPEIPLERELGEQIYSALQGSVIENIISIAKDGSNDDYWRSRMEGHCMKVEQAILPEFYDLCQEVKQRLGFAEPVDFYITGDSTLNAFSIAAEDKDKPHIVNINSSLFDLMSNDELRFVVGHELGHILNKDTALRRLIYFVFPPEVTDAPITLQYKIRLHDQLAELVADRYGYLANGNLNACITAFFKLASGLDLGKMSVSIAALLEDNRKRLEYFTKDKGLSQYDHPVNPIRVQAIHLFANATSQQELTDGMNELIGILLKVGNKPIDEALSTFIATAGLMVANADGHVTEKEVEHIINSLAGLQIFPKKFLDKIANEDVPKLFDQAMEKIMEEEPGMRTSLLKYIISLVLSDKNISKEEVELVYNFGKSIGLSEKEISVEFAGMIQRNYMPSLESIC